MVMDIEIECDQEDCEYWYDYVCHMKGKVTIDLENHKCLSKE